ncbi:PqqD family protein [Accumulibacter sp.]|uniref:PqqD family protein n=1 Tax=Accumulibacter sp. TaxID=2053492 RepID=UPI0025F67101|nr:PqqD family protein [Accumulibacter sp.]MCM8594097.1 PqqD family protein [Accumulibacter sp.]MCM8624506.1 PqqD family protein [Accumulibacter sp.]MDS4048240.1 PqqD family protein [Accumulibacter sp.]
MQTHTINSLRLKAIVLNGGAHAFDTRTGRSYSVNATAQVALLMLQDGASRDELIERLAGLCAQPESVVAAGIDGFIEQLGRYAS